MLELNLVSPDQIEKVASTLKKNAAGIATGPDEFILTKKNGERVAVEISTYPITINRKSLVLGTAHDISNRKKIEAQIRKALRDKEILLQEIHHRVKNNLQIISSLLNLQSSFVDDPRTLEIFQESQNRVRSMALVHEKLYRSQDLTSIDLAEYIEELAHHLFQTHHLNSRKIYLKVETESVFIDLDRAIPCGLMLNELISNALKHAFPAGQNGEVRVKLKIESPELLNLTVGDNGVGFPAHLDFSNAGTLGLQLVNTLVKQLGGTIELTVSHSTEFRVRFNVSP